eukprot:6479377-Lingulodinium_polyedra.AAC.1
MPSHAAATVEEQSPQQTQGLGCQNILLIQQPPVGHISIGGHEDVHLCGDPTWAKLGRWVRLLQHWPRASRKASLDCATYHSW